jgi:hypothetical protein
VLGRQAQPVFQVQQLQDAQRVGVRAHGHVVELLQGLEQRLPAAPALHEGVVAAQQHDVAVAQQLGALRVLHAGQEAEGEVDLAWKSPSATTSNRFAWARATPSTARASSAITKALLQSGVAYIGGYQGAPVSHLLDVMVQAKAYMDQLGVHVEACSNEASAAAMLGASLHYPLRGAVTWKSIVGTNVAADALSNLSSPGVPAAC